MIIKRYSWMLFFVLCVSTNIFSAGPGTLDTTFNSAGIQPGTNSTAINSAANNSIGYGITIQTDGKIIIVGQVEQAGINRFGVARFTTAGVLDTTFNSAGTLPGTVSTAIDNAANASIAYTVVLQTDGKIVVSGTVTVGGLNKFAVARFNTNGSLDTTFNAAGTLPGTVSIAINNVANDSLGFGVAVQTDGKIVVTGNVTESGVVRIGLARLNSNGTIDTTFNSAGTLPGTVSTAVDNPANDSFGGTPLLQADGKIIIDATVFEGGTAKIAAVRFNSNGTLDTTYNSGGTLPGTVSTFVDAPGNLTIDSSYKVALQSDGKLVIAGGVNEGTYKIAAVRFNTNGSLDATFNPAGTLPGTVSITIGTDDAGTGVAVQTDGKILISGSSTIADVREFTVVRLTSTGIVDTTFNSAGPTPGVVRTTIDNQESGTNINDSVVNISLQSDGKIVIAGHTVGTVSRFAVARFLAQGSIANLCA